MGADGEARAWIADWSERESEDARLRSVFRGVVRAVRYVECADSSGQPGWPGGDFDSIDYGIEIDYADGHQAAAIWLQSGDNEGLLAYAGTLRPDQLDPAADVATRDVTSRWRERGGAAITGVTTFWSRAASFQLNGVRLNWDTGAEFVIVLGERDYDSGRYRYTHSNVSVFFSPADALEARVHLDDAVDP